MLWMNRKIGAKLYERKRKTHLMLTYNINVTNYRNPKAGADYHWKSIDRLQSIVR